MSKPKGNMYQDAKFLWRIYTGCEFDCVYCKKSFQASIKRFSKPRIDKNGKKRGCQNCYDYIPHTHAGRLYQKLPLTKGDEFIWVGSSGDISFCESTYEFPKILERIKSMPERTFFFQTKNPEWFQQWEFPKNVLLGITLESNIHYPLVSKAPVPSTRAYDFFMINHRRKIITVEPIMKFNMYKLYAWIRDIRPERVYIGYDSKNNKLDEPPLSLVRSFIDLLKRITKVKEKLIREAWDEK